MKQEEHLRPQSFRETIRRRYKDRGVPVDGTFELTGRCNLNCKMCYVHTHPNEYFARGEHDGDWWIAQIDQACELGMMFALLTGGECLLHPDFKRIYRHLRQQGVYTSVFTNGLLLTEDMVDFLKENPPFEVQMTLYGADDDAYEAVTGVRAFDRAAAAIRRMKASGINFRVAVTPSSHSAGETEKILAYLKEQGVNYRINKALFSTYDMEGPGGQPDQEANVEEKIRYFTANLNRKLQAIPMEQLPPVGGGQTEPVYGLRCSGGKVSFWLTWDGYMQGCNAFHYQRIPVPTPEDFPKAWEQLKTQSKLYPLPVECEGCPYRKVCLACPVQRGGKVGSGHCDPAVCDMTRRLVAAGVKKLELLE